ncbi:MAG: amidohydrolase [Candidatus Eisenbacteria bacterium]|nr:amidohydrolase [Candidatus Latescibacterota bacterium]MBD3300881.1 amidohydrolase [Candidatus Eisenbacteria bacterium]
MRTLPAGLLVLALAVAAPAGGGSPDFESLADAHAEEAIRIRRTLHARAELSLREHETQRIVRERLAAIPGIEIVPGDWGTGIVARLAGGRPGPTVAYRSDMDALPIREETGLPFACVRTDTLDGRAVGVMHACGHDFHMAILLGVAAVLSEVRERLPGSVLFLLEPAEEIGAGARMLLEAGVFEEGREPAAIFATHVHPSLPVGRIGYCPGYATGNVDTFRLRIAGVGGHGAYPHETVDPVVLAARTVLALQTLVSREIDTAKQAVVSVGSIHGGTKSNVIPDEVVLTGTIRTLDPAVRDQIHGAIPRLVTGIAASAGAPEPETRTSYGTPSLYNDPEVVTRSLPVLRRVLGEENVVAYDPAMGGEDFARFATVVPGFLFRLGVGRPDREMALHRASFDPDERAIPLGMRVVAELLWEHLAGPDTAE